MSTPSTRCASTSPFACRTATPSASASRARIPSACRTVTAQAGRGAARGELAHQLGAGRGRPRSSSTASASASRRSCKEKETALAQFLAKHPEFAREAASRGRTRRARRSAPPRGQRGARGGAPKGDATLASLEREAAACRSGSACRCTQQAQGRAAGRPAARRRQGRRGERAASRRRRSSPTSRRSSPRSTPTCARRAARVKDGAGAGSSAPATRWPQHERGGSRRATAKEADEGYIDRGALENQLKRINEEIAEYKRHKADDAPAATTDGGLVGGGARDRLGAAQPRGRRRARSLPVAAGQGVQGLDGRERRRDGATAQMVVVDPAFVPTHAAPPGRTMLMAAGLAADDGAVGCCSRSALALVDDRLYDRVDIERLGCCRCSAWCRGRKEEQEGESWLISAVRRAAPRGRSQR